MHTQRTILLIVAAVGAAVAATTALVERATLRSIRRRAEATARTPTEATR